MSAAGGLMNFLERKKITTAGEMITHQTLPPNPSKYFIGDDDLQQFYELYHEYVAVWNNKIALVESPYPALGLCKVDLDFLYEPGTTENLHTRDQIVNFSIEYVKTLKTFLVSPDPVEVYVMEKKLPVKKEKGMAGGVHIMVPAMRTNKHIEIAVRNIMLTKMSAFDDLPLKVKEWSKVYDEAVAKRSSGLIMYGASKPGGLPYLVTYRIMVTGDEAVVDDTPVPFTVELLKRLDIRERDPAKETQMTEEAKKQYGNLPETNVENVRISGGRAIAPSRGRPAERRVQGSRDSSPNNIAIRPLSPEELQNIRDHIANLKDDRANNYNEEGGGGWIDVGMCLKNIHPELYDEFEEFSRRSPQFNVRECMSKWNSFSFRNHGQKLGMGSLFYWSKMDNPEEYKNIEDRNILRKVDASKGGAEYDVASVVYSRFRDEYKCVNFGKNVWYRYVGHGWIELDKGVQLQQELSITIWKLYIERAGYYGKKLVDNEACQAKNPVECGCSYCVDMITQQQLFKVATQLKKTAFKQNVMRECSELFLDEQFTKKIDENRHLLACSNGVFDMNTCEFRDGKPEDYVSFSTSLDYDKDKSYKDYREWTEINDFLHKIFPIKRVREYQTLHLARCLNGVGNQKFHTWTGVGSNGKSMLICLMESSLGDYACKVPIALLTQGRNKSGAAAPELIRLKGRRFVTMQEPDESVPLNTGFMKELTSGEKIIARDLYAGSKSMIEFELQAKLHLACNDKPKINTNDGGTWRRFVVINFISKFVPTPAGPNQYKMDMSIERKVKSEEWGKCFLAYLIQTYTAHANEDIVPPAEILEYTNEYREESNAIMRFINEYTRETVEGEEVVPVRRPTLSDKFKQWWETNRGTRDWSIQGMLKEIETKYGKYAYGGWTTFQLRNDVD
jgi:P4 family phage/plasmid primase-like protien